MSLDDKTEVIAHFIGIFELTVEAARMRLQYDEISSQLRADPELGGLLQITVNLTSAYDLGEFYPALKAPFFLPTMPAAVGTYFGGYIGLQGPAKVFSGTTGLAESFPALPTHWAPLTMHLDAASYWLIPPSSIATINLQKNVLVDADVLWNGPELPVVAQEDLEAALFALAEAGFLMRPFEVPDLPADEEAIAEGALQLSEAARVFEAKETGPGTEAPEGLSIYLARNEDAAGITQDGETAEEMPGLPEYSHRFAPAEEEEPEEEPSEGPQHAEGETIVITEEDFEATHELGTGKNVLLNEAHIATNWLDAPVFMVMGDLHVSANITQVNVWNDHDTFIGAPATDTGSTQGVNAAALSWEANPAAEKEGTEAPQGVAVTRIDGNVLSFNHVQQFNFAIDSDVVNVGFSARETFIQMGDNSLVNMAGLLELGFHYDMIVIGGSMIDVTLISQMNLLLDADILETSEGFGGLLTSSGNLLFNLASISEQGIDTPLVMGEAQAKTAKKVAEDKKLKEEDLDDPAFAGTEVLNVLHISGHFLDVQIIEQVNVLGDSDQVRIAAEGAQGKDGATVKVNTGQNELINLASVTEMGLDSTVYTGGEVYSDALLYQAEFLSIDDPFAPASAEGLASEAVLFLAEGMVTEGSKESAGDGIYAPPPEETHVDVMQSILA